MPFLKGVNYASRFHMERRKNVQEIFGATE
jgi:hypothetical protein